MGGGIFAREIADNMELFLSPGESEEVRTAEKIKNDNIDCYLRFGATPQEYFLFGFRRLTNRRRSRFLTNQHKDKVCIARTGMRKYLDELRNKYNFYLLEKEYFKRDVCKIESAADFEAFEAFCTVHPEFIVKPLDGMCGQGAAILRGITGERIKDTFERLSAGENEWIVEELITQDKRMAQWNASSVNTVRLPTFLTAEGFQVTGSVFRTGRRGNPVDNAAAGGIVASVDPRTGILTTDGVDESGHTFKEHPDSHIGYKGWQIPRWEELLGLAEEAHRRLASHIYIGWDFALTDGGWVLIEGDWGQFLNEFSERKGIRKKFDRLMRAKGEKISE